MVKTKLFSSNATITFKPLKTNNVLVNVLVVVITCNQ
jgi:hypothetical protein